MSGKRSGKKSSIKRKSLFDHINQITKIQNPNYWEQISEEDKKTWSNYMVNRFLSMKSDWIDSDFDVKFDIDEIATKLNNKAKSKYNNLK